jgi:hypothetical protein
MREHITTVAFDMHRESITAAWLLAGETSPEVRTIPHGCCRSPRNVGF